MILSVPSSQMGRCEWFIHIYPPVEMEPTERSETSAFNIQTPDKYPEKNIPDLTELNGIGFEPFRAQCN
jgi:hypothetical protein